jgi:type II secretory pathway pseudopilin PulG
MVTTKLRDNAGVTLLELMFASGVLALALSMLFGSLISISALSTIAEERTVAAAQVASVAEEVRNLNFDALIDYTPPPVGGPGVHRTVLIEVYDADGTAMPLPLAGGGGATPTLPNPVEVKITMVWETAGGRVYSSYVTTQVGR